MDDEDRPDHESVIDRAKDAVSNFFGGATENAAEHTPDIVSGDMRMNSHELQDVGMGTTDVVGDPYGGSAGSEAQRLADNDAPDDPLIP